MDVDLIFKIVAVGIIVAVINMVLIRSGRRNGNADDTGGVVVVLVILIRKSVTCSIWSSRCLIFNGPL